MKTSHVGIALIKEFEALRLEAYEDMAGVWTIGYGHTGSLNGVPISRGMRIRESDAELLLLKDLKWRENRLSEWCDFKDIALTQNQFDAIMSWIFNLGWSAFAYQSSFAKLLAAGDKSQAAIAMTWWNKADIDRDGVTEAHEIIPGLVRRRTCERMLFEKPDDSAGDSKGGGPQD